MTYLAQLVDDRWVEEHQLHPWDGQLQPHPLRMPWARPAGPQADLAWGWQQLAARRNRPAGPAIQHKTWNLSAVWELPDTNGTAWLKTVAPFGRHEAVVLKLLADHPVPQLLGHDRHRILLGDMSGTDGFGATVAEHLAIVDTLVDMQLATIDCVPQALTRGVPDRRTPRLATELAAFLQRRTARDPALRQMATDLPARLQALADCDLPDVIVHGDAHPGNARIGSGRPVLFDWSDSFTAIRCGTYGEDLPATIPTRPWCVTTG